MSSRKRALSLPVSDPADRPGVTSGRNAAGLHRATAAAATTAIASASPERAQAFNLGTPQIQAQDEQIQQLGTMLQQALQLATANAVAAPATAAASSSSHLRPRN